MAEAPDSGTPSPKLASTAKSMGDKFRQAMTPTPEPAPVLPTPQASDKSKVPVPTLTPAAGEVPPKPAVTPEPPKSDKEINFGKLRGEFDEFRTKSEKRVSALQSELDNSRNSWTAEKAALETQLKEYQEIVQRTALENDPRFKQAFDSRITNALTDGKEAVGSAKAALVEAAFNMADGEQRDARIKEIGSELTSFEQMGLITAYGNFKKAQRERKAELQKAAENVKGLQLKDEQTAKELAEQRKSEIATVFNKEIGEFSKSVPDFQPSEKDEAHNKLVLETVERAKSWIDLDMTDGVNLVRLALWASKGFNALAREAALAQELDKLQKQVTALTSASPRLNGSGQPGAKPRPSGTGKVAEDIASRYKEAMERGVPTPAT